jgi:hypothetical protein
MSTLSLSILQQVPYLVDGDDLTSGLLDLAELLEEVPETRLGNDVVRSEKSHSEELGDGFLLRRKLTTDHLSITQKC